jgi:F-type H+-transporting ATPase subunit b
MSIDWVTVLAQLANFLVLVWLLRRFLYRPILDGIDAREAEIARRLAAADDAREQADAAKERYLSQYTQSVSEQQAVVAEALRATKSERNQLMADARAQQEQEQKEWQLQLEHEREDFLERLRRAGALTLAELLRKILHDLADETLEAAIARHLGRRLAPMMSELLAATGTTRQALITTREDLGAETQDALRAELSKLLPNLDWEFRVDSDQACGVMIQAAGARLVWTIDSYMDEFDRLLTQNHPAAAAALSYDHGR